MESGQLRSAAVSDHAASQFLTGMVRAVPRRTLGLVGALSLTQVVMASAFAVALAQALSSLVLTGGLRISLVMVATGCLLSRAALNHATRRLCDNHASTVVRRARNDLTEVVLGMGSVALSRLRAGDIAALDAGLERLHPVYARYLPNLASCVAAALVLPPVLLWLDPSSGLVVLITLPLSVLFLILVGTATAATVDEQWQSHVRLGSRLVDITRNMATIDAFGATRAYRDVFETAAERHAKVTGKVLRSAFLNGFVLEAAAILSTALAAVWIGVRLVGGTAELAPTMAALILLGEVFIPLRALGTERHAAMDAVPIRSDLVRLTSIPPIRSGATPVPAVSVVELGDCAALLDDSVAVAGPLGLVTGRLEVGHPMALRGRSGIGKSTLLLALAGHADYSGSMRVDGFERSDLDLTAWRTRVVYVPQRPRVVAGTVLDNVRLVEPAATASELADALDRVGLADCVAALPAGVDTPVGAGGAQLSGGETARLALARALVSPAPVILLDEVTAHLDPATANDIVGVVEECFADRVVLLATHLAAPPGWGELRPFERDQVPVP